jgi:hypothetical protein
MMKIETGMRVRILAPWNGEDDPYTGRMGIVDAASPGAVFVTLDEPVHPCRYWAFPPERVASLIHLTSLKSKDLT